MKLFKGQQLAEISVVAISIFGIAILGLYFFGNNLANIFDKNNVASIYGGSRDSKAIDPHVYLSNVNLTIGNMKFQSPVESAIRQQMTAGNLVETSGSNGNIRDTVGVIQSYINQYNQIVQTLPASPSKDALISALNGYNTDIKEYVSKDNSYVSGTDDPLAILVNELDIAIDINKNGGDAKTLSSAGSSLTNSLPDGELKNLINVLTNNTLNLGSSIDYKIDSRVISKLNIPQSTVTKITTAADVSSLTPTMQSYAAELAQITQNINDAFMKINNPVTAFSSAQAVSDLLSTTSSVASTIPSNAKDYYSYLNGTNSHSYLAGPGFTTTSGASIYVNEFYQGCPVSTQHDLNNLPECADIGIDVNGSAGPNIAGEDLFFLEITPTGIIPDGGTGSVDDPLTTCVPGSTGSNNNGWGCAGKYLGISNTNTTSLSLQDLKDYLVKIDNDPTISTDEKTLIAKQIKLYRNGNYSDILPDSYNSSVLCTTIGATASNGNCNLTN